MRKLYYSYTPMSGLSVIVDKKKGLGLLRSYGEHHQTELDNLLAEAGFECEHPDGYLHIAQTFQNHWSADKFESHENMLKALQIVCDYYKVSERVKLTHNEFYSPSFIYK